MKNISYIDNLYGGVDSRTTYDEEGKIIYWDSSKNVSIDGRTFKKANGQTSKVQNSGYSCLGLGQFEVNGIYWSRAIFSDGNYYNLDEINGSLSTARKSSLSSVSNPYFTQFKNKMVVLTGQDDPFMDDQTDITQTGLYAAKGVYGTCAEEFAGKLFIGSGRTLYWSATGDPTDWTGASDAGFDANFIGDIVNLYKLDDYLIVYTTQAIYAFSGYDFQTFQKTNFASLGVASRDNVVVFDDKHFVFNEFGFYELKQLGDMAQLQTSTPLSYRVHDEMMKELDKSRMSEIKLVSYEDKRQIWIYIPIKNQSTITKCWVADFQNFYDSKVIAFYPREANAITCAGTLKNKIYTGTSTGKIYKEDDGYTFDGTVIDSNISITISLGSKSSEKVAEFLKIFCSALDKNTFKLERGYNGRYNDTVSLNVNVSTPYFIMDVSELDIVPLGDGSDMLEKRLSVNRKRFTTLKLTFKATASGDNFQIHGFALYNVGKTRAV